MKRLLLALACAAFVCAAALSAQQATFRTRVDTVDVHVTVRDANGKLVTDLGKDEFELYDNGKLRDIALFSADAQPIAISLLLDRSGSVAGQAKKVLAAADIFAGELLPGDRVALHTLSFECLPLTTDTSQLHAVLQKMVTTDFGSPIWSGLDRTMTSMSSQAGRRAILLFSDGFDGGPPIINSYRALMGFPQVGPQGPCHEWSNVSESTFSDVVKRAQRDGVMVYTVSVEDTSGRTNDGDLRTIAQKSGGERYRLKQLDQLSDAFKRIADELHHQYLLGFVPTSYDGKVHELDVRVKRPGLTVRSRKSYVADQSEAAGNVRTPPAPLLPLTTEEVDAALRNGAAGQKLQAGCSASGALEGSQDEYDAMAVVTLEGPVGRIMRMAREAKQKRQDIDANDISDDMRKQVVQVSAELKTTVPATRIITDASAPPDPAQLPPPTRPRPISGLTALQLRSKTQTEVTLEPEYDATTTPKVGWTPMQKLIAYLDLAAFRALPGPDVEILVRSGAGTRRCSIGEKERASVK